MSAPLLIPKKLSKREAWLEERRSYIGASEVAAVLGESPYLSGHELWRIKTQGLVVEETTPMRLGLAIEPFIGKEFTRKYGLKIKRSSLYRHPKWPFLACNPDYEIAGGIAKDERLAKLCKGRRGLLQAKYASFWPGQQWGTEAGDQVPQHYLIQIAAELIVTGFDYIILCVLIDGRELKHYAYSFDPELFDCCTVLDRDMGKSIVYRVATYWDTHIVKGIEPELTGHDCDTGYVKYRRNDYQTGGMINADEECTNWCLELAKRRAVRKLAEEQEAEAANQIKQYMAENAAEVLEVPGFDKPFTWRKNVKGVATFNPPFRSNNV